MDRFDAMAAFVAVCEADGFAAGGRRLGLSPSATTRLIGALEARLGARLLQRTTRSLSLTDAGRRYLERATRILAELREAEEGLKAEGAVPRGRLVVAAPRLFGRLHVAPFVSTLMRRFAGVTAELQLNDRLINLVEEGVDVAIRIGMLADSSLVARRLGETRRVVVASPAYLDRAGRPRHPEDLSRHEITKFGSLEASSAWAFVGGDGRALSVALAPRFITDSAEAAIDHVTAGGGLTQVLAYQARESVSVGRLEVVLADHEAAPVPISAVYPSSRLLSAKVRAFVALIATEADWRFTDFPPEERKDSLADGR